MRNDLGPMIDRAVASLEHPSRFVNGRVLVGRPATMLVEAASEIRAELVVVGSRGRGPIASMVLGSVSAELVDHAQCPVLVCRGGTGRSVLVAVDGSRSAHAAVTFLVANRLVAAQPMLVLSVAPGVQPSLSYDAAGTADPDSLVRIERSVERQRAEDHAAAAAERLRGAGYRTTWTIGVGDPAHQIIDAAGAFDAGLIVMGSRGLSGLDRIVLGSVARNVLLHASTSVLIVHEPVRVEDRETVKAQRAPAAAVATPA
jgi:nucleotide-binding universal stress UspA family protein